MELEDVLAQSMDDQLDRVTPPPPDLREVIRRGRGRQTRRYAATTVLSIAVLMGGFVAFNDASDSEQGGTTVTPEPAAPVGQLDFTNGLRAYMSPDPDGGISLGGRTFPSADLDYIDTDAAATPYGMVYFDDDQQAHLLREDGTDVVLERAAGPSEGFHPSPKADGQLPLVAWSEVNNGAVTVRLYDLSAGEAVAEIDVPCAADCSDVRVDAVDQGLVFVQTADGTFVWDHYGRPSAQWTSFSGPNTEVADVRSRRILFTGPTPQPAQNSPIDATWSFTYGPIDGQLSFDGNHLLNWSTVLEPTAPGGQPIRLDVPRSSPVFVTFDTDGSVLVSTPDPSSRLSNLVFDCNIPSGLCTELGSLMTEFGDPIFVGNDM